MDIGTNLTVAFSPNFKSINFWDLMYEHYTPLATDGILVDVKDEL